MPVASLGTAVQADRRDAKRNGPRTQFIYPPRDVTSHSTTVDLGLYKGGGLSLWVDTPCGFVLVGRSRESNHGISCSSFTLSFRGRICMYQYLIRSPIEICMSFGTNKACSPTT